MPHATPIPVHLIGIAVMRRAASVPVPQHQLEAIVAFIQWLYAPEQQRLIAAVGSPPVIADAAIQDTYWTKTAPPTGLVPAGQWSRLSSPFAGMPSGAPLATVVNPVLNKYGTRRWTCAP